MLYFFTFNCFPVFCVYFVFSCMCTVLCVRAHVWPPVQVCSSYWFVFILSLILMVMAQLKTHLVTHPDLRWTRVDSSHTSVPLYTCEKKNIFWEEMQKTHLKRTHKHAYIHTDVCLQKVWQKMSFSTFYPTASLPTKGSRRMWLWKNPYEWSFLQASFLQ